MRKLPTIAAILALAIMPGMAAAQQSPSQAQAAGKALGAASLQSGRLTPAESNRASQNTGSSNVWGGAYTGNPDSTLTAKQSETSMIGIGNKAINESVSSFQGYNTSRDDQASQATYFLTKNPVLKPTISPQDPMIPAAHSGIGTQVFASSSTTECKQVDVTTPRDPNEIYSCLETYQPYVVPCSNDSIASFDSVAAPNVPAGISSYYCPSGQILSGSTCTATTTTTSPANTVYSCSPGGTLSGTICNYNGGYAATPSYSCPAGTTKSGDSCIASSSYAASAVEVCTTYGPTFTLFVVANNQPKVCTARSVPSDDPSCSYLISQTPMQFTRAVYGGGGGQGASWNCQFQPAQQYSCPSGGTLSGNMCSTTSVVPSTFTGYSCPSGGTLSGSTCVTSYSAPAAMNQTCSNGGALSGSTCSVTSTTNTSATPNYYCPSGYQVSGSTCTGKMVDQMVTKEVNGCGALEGLAQ